MNQSATHGVRKQVIDTARLLHDRAWVANHDGNITARLGPNRYLATPTATSKRAVDNQRLIEVDGTGKRLSGTARSFSELGLHLAVYRRRPDVHAVVHAHPPHATAIGCSAGNLIAQPFIAEAVVSLGPSIPKVPFAMPGAAAERALAAVVEDVDAALLANHGVMAWGADVEQAYLRLELVEHLARIALLAVPIGGVQPLPATALPALLDARARAGLGRAAAAAQRVYRQVAATPEIASANTAQSARSQDDVTHDEVATIVRQEIQRVLAKGD